MGGPEVKAGLLSGLIYGIPLSLLSLWAMVNQGPEGFASIISPLVQLPYTFVESLYMITLIVTVPVILLYFSFLGLLFGLFYGWALSKAGREWAPLLALVTAGLLALAASLTVNVPITRLELLGFSVATSPVYGFSLLFLYRRFELKFDPSWMSELDETERRILLALDGKKVKVFQLSEMLSMKREDLVKVLNSLEEREFVACDYENRYRLTEKGKLCVKALNEKSS